MLRVADFSFEPPEGSVGKLSIDIHYNGRLVPASIRQGEDKKYRISFQPIGGGTYIIKAYLEGKEINGSPFTMQIIDAKDVVTTGEGLSYGEVGKRATFTINVGQGSEGADIKVRVLSPRGRELIPRIFNKGQGDIIVEFIPNDAGEHQIEVTYHDQPVSGSPFLCQVGDISQISLLSLPMTANVNQPVEFTIDVSRVGTGQLQIFVNNGNVECNLQKLSNSHYQAMFIPQDAGTHVIQMRFNGQDVPGGPWVVDVRQPYVPPIIQPLPQSQTTTMTTMVNPVQNIPINTHAEFEILTSNPSSVVQATITTTSRQNVPANVVNLGMGKFRVEFTPREACSHMINVTVDNMTVVGSPFLFKVYNSAAILVNPINIGLINTPMEFSIDASKAGEGKLEIMINKGAVSNNVRGVGKGLFIVSFVPTEARTHVIDVMFNDELIPQCPIQVPIMDAQGRSLQHIKEGSGSDNLHEVAVNKQSTFKLQQSQHQQFRQEDLSLIVTSPTGEHVPARMVLQPDGDYKLDYSSRYTGRHRVEILNSGVPIMGSPFFVEIYDPNRIKIEGNRKGIVGERMEIYINRQYAGKAEMRVTVKGPRGNIIRHEMRNTPKGDHVTYVPQEPGIHNIFVTYGGLNVPGCPIKQDIYDTHLIIAEGDGLRQAFEDQVATFFVDAKGQKGDLAVQVEGPHSIAKCNVTMAVDGRYVVTYVPVESGIFTIIIKWNGREINGSPFRPKVLRPGNLSVIGGWESHLDQNNRMRLKINTMKSIEFDLHQAGPGQLSANCRGPSGMIPVEIKQIEKDIVAMTFTPKEEGEYVLKIFWNGKPIERFPITGNIMKVVTETITESRSTSHHNQNIYSMDKVIMTGIGLQQAITNHHSEFFIDGTDAGPGSPSVILTGPGGDLPVQVILITPLKYKCTYYPSLPGIYSLVIKWADRNVVGSPYHVNIQASTSAANTIYAGIQNNPYLTPTNDAIAKTNTIATNTTIAGLANKVQATGDGLNGSVQFGKELKININASRGGKGEIHATCHGPTKPALCKLINHGKGEYTMNIKPVESGKHYLNIKFNNEHINGSPFQIKVMGPPDPSKVKVYGPGINSGYIDTFQSHFTVDTQGAGAGDLGVTVKGPKGGFKVEMHRKSNKDRKIQCKYDPQEPGIYMIQVTWSGLHVPGSPFEAHIASPGDETDYHNRGEYIRGEYNRGGGDFQNNTRHGDYQKHGDYSRHGEYLKQVDYPRQEYGRQTETYHRQNRGNGFMEEIVN